MRRTTQLHRRLAQSGVETIGWSSRQRVGSQISSWPASVATARIPIGTAGAATRRFAHTETHRQRMHTSIDEAKVHACYHALRVSVGSDVTAIREQYLQLAKELHPDTTGNEAGDDFQRVHEAYTFLTSLHRDVLQHVGDKAARHARYGDAPPSSASGSSHQPVPNAAHANVVQHREYLRNEGVGHGHNPAERDRQYKSHRLERGMSGALDYRANRWTETANARALADDDSSSRPNDLAPFDSLLAITRAGGGKHIASVTLIEEQIKDAISRWDPREIKDFGKPLSSLQYDSGSMIDPLEAKLNNILWRNGVLPDWMQLERNLVADHDATLGELHYCWAEFVTAEQWKEGTAIKAQLAQHRLQSAAAAAAATAASTPPIGVQAASAPPTPIQRQAQPPLPQLSPRAVELGLSHAAPFGPAWALAVSEFHKSLRAVNTAVDSFNLTVPSSSRQRVHYSSEGIVQGVESAAPNRDAGATQERRVRERIASFRRSRKGSKATLTASNHLAASINGAPDGATLSLAQLAAAEDGPSGVGALLQFDSPAATAIDTSGLTESEMEALYRSLSSGERTELEQEEARRRRLQQHTALPPAVVTALLATSAAVIALPVWLLSSRKQAAATGNED